MGANIIVVLAVLYVYVNIYSDIYCSYIPISIYIRTRVTALLVFIIAIMPTMTTLMILNTIIILIASCE